MYHPPGMHDMPSPVGLLVSHAVRPAAFHQHRFRSHHRAVRRQHALVPTLHPVLGLLASAGARAASNAVAKTPVRRGPGHASGTRPTGNPHAIHPHHPLAPILTPSQACGQCRARKRRCDAMQPCQHCVREEHECVYTRSPNLKSASPPLLSSPQPSLPAVH